jgi:hypothetical protein
MHNSHEFLDKICKILQRQKQTKISGKLEKLTVFRVLTNKNNFPYEIELDDIKIESVNETNEDFVTLVKKINPFFNFNVSKEKLKYYKKYYFITNKIYESVKNLFNERQLVSYFSIYDITNQTDILLYEHRQNGASDQSLFKTFEEAKNSLYDYCQLYNNFGLEMKVAIRKHNFIGDILEETTIDVSEL